MNDFISERIAFDIAAALGVPFAEINEVLKKERPMNTEQKITFEDMIPDRPYNFTTSTGTMLGKYKKRNEKLYSEDFPSKTYSPSVLNFNVVAAGYFTECEFNPEICERYYFVDPRLDSGVNSYLWQDDETDNNIKNHIGIHRTFESAKEQADKIFRNK